jgi:hypothetical protein
LIEGHPLILCDSGAHIQNQNGVCHKEGGIYADNLTLGDKRCSVWRLRS